jgi:tetratricopeptide (TPR) repeat protein
MLEIYLFRLTQQMKRKNTLVLSMLLILILMSVVSCSWWQKDEKALQRDSYRRMLELQKAKTEAMNKEFDKGDRLPEPGADDFERLGDQYVRQGNSNMAIVFYDKALKADAKRINTQYKMGILLISKGLLDEAEDRFNEIIKINENSELAYEGKGRVALLRGNLNDAINDFKKATQINKDMWQAFCFMGIIADRLQRHEEAIAYYHKAIAINPKSADLFNNLGMSYALMGEYEKALQALITASDLGSNGKIFNNIGLVLGKLGRYDEALASFKKGGDEASAYNNLGCIYLAEENYAKAIKAFEKAIALNPKYYVRAKDNLNKAEALLKEEKTAN